MSKVLKMAAAYAMLAAQSENRNFSPYTVDNRPEPEWKRKKCKSCYNFTMAYQQCPRNPNNQGCKNYMKRK